ncbi:carbohydrate sulfotransferase 1-like [Ptychodera flava]|uniref:carbohydrate sulfotransferase 1-like n=1 Tax=Ptychodera flava TaxID=63121 RepID=UPI00396A0A5A
MNSGKYVRATGKLLLLVLVGLSILFITYRQPFNSKEQVISSRPIEDPDGSVSKSTDNSVMFNENKNQNGSQIHTLVIGRMQSGSTATGSLLGKLEDSFYVYEPDHVILGSIYHRNVHIDSADNLEAMQPYLCQFLGALYSCNFSSYDYFVRGFRCNGMLRKKGFLTDFLSDQVTEAELASFCKSKTIITSKVVRFIDVKSCLPTLQRNNVKMVFLARDPRGLIISRLRHMGNRLASFADDSNVNYYPIEYVVKEHCHWLDSIYNLLRNGSKWLKDNSMLIRFEDLSLYPHVINSAIYDFVGLTPPPAKYVPRNESASSWFKTNDYARMKKFQEYCPEHVYDEFGWVRIKSEDDFEKAKTSSSWYREMPGNGVILKYTVP